MIIFAKVSGGKFLLEATPDEMAQILGFDNIGDARGVSLNLGDVIPVTGIYEKAKAVSGGKNTIDKAARDLQKVVDDLGDIEFEKTNQGGGNG